MVNEMTNLEKLLSSNRRKKSQQRKRKMGNTKNVWTKEALKKHTIMVIDDEEDA